MADNEAKLQDQMMAGEDDNNDEVRLEERWKIRYWETKC